MKSWLFVGAKVTPRGRYRFTLVNIRPWKLDFWRSLGAADPVFGRVYVVTEVRKDERSELYVGLEGFVLMYTAYSFKPVSTTDTSKTVEAMRSLMLKATQRGKVRA